MTAQAPTVEDVDQPTAAGDREHGYRRLVVVEQDRPRQRHEHLPPLASLV